MLIVSIVTTLEQWLWGRIPFFRSTRFSLHFLLRNACFHGCLSLPQISQYIIPNGVFIMVINYGLYLYVVKLNFLRVINLKVALKFPLIGFQIFPLVASSVNLTAFFIRKFLALFFVIVNQKSARFREPHIGWIPCHWRKDMKFLFF